MTSTMHAQESSYQQDPEEATTTSETIPAASNMQTPNSGNNCHVSPNPASSSTSNNNNNSQNVSILRKTSISSQASSEGGGDRYSPRRVSIAKASNLTVALSGGNPKSKQGTLRRRSNSVFSTYRESFVAVDDGDLTFQVREDDVDNREVYSLLAIREVKLTAAGSCQFQLKLAEQTPLPTTGYGGSNGSSLISSFAEFSGASQKHRTVVLKAGSNKEAMEWIATIKHELKNQILVCKNLFSTLQSEGHQERAEPLFEQMVELLRVVYDGREHFEVADTLRSYGKWLENQGRSEEAALMKRQAKAIKRRCEEGLDTTLSRDQESTSTASENGTGVSRRFSATSRLPPLRKT